MHSRSSAALSGLLILFLGLVLFSAVPARAERVQSNLVLIRSEDVVSEDLYAAGDIVQVDGRVEGDLYAIAYQEVRINGTVTGDVVALAGRVVISGEVGGSVRAAAATVVIDGRVGDDVFVGARRVRTGPASVIGRDLLVWSWSAVVEGTVGRNFEGSQRSATLDGAVTGDVEVTVETLHVGRGARVSGYLAYRSHDRASVADGAVFEGALIHRQPLPVNVRVRGMLILVRVLGIAGAAILGLTLLWASPHRTDAAMRAVSRRPAVVIGWGLAVLATPALLAGLVVLVASFSPPEAGLPLVLVLAPLVAAAVGLLFVALMLAPVPVATAVGHALPGVRSNQAAFLIGLAFLVVFQLVPWVGSVIVGLAVMAGIGGWLVPPDVPG